MVLLVALTQTPQDLDGVGDGRLTHHHGLEAALQGRIPLNVLAVLVEGGGSDALQLAAGQGGFENVGGIDSALGGTGSDQGVNLIDHQDHVPGGADLLHDLLEAFLELAAVLGAGHQQADVEGEDPLVLKDVGDIALGDALREPLSDGGLADARFADQDGVVLGASAEDLDHPIDLVVAAHHGIQLGFGRHLGEVVAELIKGRCLGGSLAATAGGDLGGLAEHADHLGAHLGKVNAEVLEHPSGHALALANKAEQQVFGADVVVAELAGFLQGELKHPLGPGGEGDLHRHETGAPADDLLNLDPSVLQVDSHRLENLGGHAGALTDQPEQDLLRSHEVMTQPSGLLLGQHDHLDGLLGKPLEHGPGPVAVIPTYQD